MKKFEYKIVPIELNRIAGNYRLGIDLDATEALLTGEGLEGWEAISTFNDTAASGQIKTYILLKREVESDLV